MIQVISKKWWTYLLYIDNIVTDSNLGRLSPQEGLAENWYLTCDMQMFVLSPLFIYPLWKWKRAGLALVVVCLFSYIGATALPYIFIPDFPAVGILTTRYLNYAAIPIFHYNRSENNNYNNFA